MIAIYLCKNCVDITVCWLLDPHDAVTDIKQRLIVHHDGAGAILLCPFSVIHQSIEGLHCAGRISLGWIKTKVNYGFLYEFGMELIQYSRDNTRSCSTTTRVG